jgi:hypothetical protein
MLKLPSRTTLAAPVRRVPFTSLGGTVDVGHGLDGLSHRPS